jgi:hypothetical protein
MLTALSKVTGHPARPEQVFVPVLEEYKKRQASNKNNSEGD